MRREKEEKTKYCCDDESVNASDGQCAQNSTPDESCGWGDKLACGQGALAAVQSAGARVRPRSHGAAKGLESRDLDVSGGERYEGAIEDCPLCSNGRNIRRSTP